MVVGLGSRSRRGEGGRGRRDDGIIYIVTPVRSESLSAPGVRLTFPLYVVSSFVFHSSAFTCTYILTSVQVPRPCFTFFVLFAFHVRLRDGASRFMRSLSIFHDSVFYCLYESFYPAFLPTV